MVSNQLKTLKHTTISNSFNVCGYEFINDIIVTMMEHNYERRDLPTYEINIIQYVKSKNHVKMNIETVYKSELFFETVNKYDTIVREIMGVQRGKCTNL